MAVNMRLLAVVLSGFVLGACAFGERQALLKYPPPAPETAGAVSSAQAAPMAAGKTVYFAAPLEDLRQEKRIVGHVLNGFGMKTAEVVAQNDVPKWVADAMRWELQKAGYAVRDGTAPPGGGTTITGGVLHVYCSAYFTYSGEVHIRAKLASNGRNVLERAYTGKGSGGLNVAATAEGYAETLALALQDALRQLIADLNRTLG